MPALSPLQQKKPQDIGPSPETPQHLVVATRRVLEFHDLTAQVEARVAASGARAGVVTIRSMHTTAAVFLGEWQEALVEDYRRLLERLVPDSVRWKHNDPRHSDCDRRNAAAHLRALLLGSSVSLPVRGGRVERGRWQSIILAELDGPRTRSIGIDVQAPG